MTTHLVFSAFTYSPVFLLATTKASAFSFIALRGSTFLQTIRTIYITSAILVEYSECRICMTTKVFLLQVHDNGNEYKPSVVSSNKKQAKVEAATISLQALGILPSWNMFLINH